MNAVDAAQRLLTNPALARDKFMVWCTQLPPGCTLAMEANKNARILWAVMTRGEVFDADHLSLKLTGA